MSRGEGCIESLPRSHTQGLVGNLPRFHGLGTGQTGLAFLPGTPVKQGSVLRFLWGWTPDPAPEEGEAELQALGRRQRRAATQAPASAGSSRWGWGQHGRGAGILAEEARGVCQGSRAGWLEDGFLVKLIEVISAATFWIVTIFSFYQPLLISLPPATLLGKEAVL